MQLQSTCNGKALDKNTSAEAANLCLSLAALVFDVLAKEIAIMFEHLHESDRV